MPKTAICELESLSTYSPSKWYAVEKLPDETAFDYDCRTWRERAHYTDDTHDCFIPGIQFCNSLKAAAKFISSELQIPGKGKARYTKNFEAGVMVVGNVMLGVKKEELLHETKLVPADGRRGGTTRVPKNFPIIPKWSGIVKYILLDDTIPKDKFELVLSVSGNLIGIGRWRPINWGDYGRFKINRINWEDGVVVE